jgi:hypothetical protein
MTENASPSPSPLPSRARGGKRVTNNVRLCPIKNVFIIISRWFDYGMVEIMR